MNLIELLGIALGLSMDAFAVSVSSGVTARRFHLRHGLLLGTFFGGFQALMPVVGWLAGIGLRSYITAFDHWIAFGLLAVIGGKMIYESFVLDEDGKHQGSATELATLLVLSIATSIDALAVGLSLCMLRVAIIKPAVVIGIVTFILSFTGVYVGVRVGHWFEKKIEVAGGVILIVIGVKILLQHTL
ncbi:manganese efflux pump [bacterium]|nr:manganese efflux pump [bacterium]